MDDDFELDTLPASEPTVPSVSVPQPKPMEAVIPTEDTPDQEERLGTTGQISISQEATRAKIAWTFTQVFLLIVIIALVLPSVVKIGFPDIIPDAVETTKTLITLIASVLAGPFGFIVGFYFKQEREG